MGISGAQESDRATHVAPFALRMLAKPGYKFYSERHSRGKRERDSRLLHFEHICYHQ